MAGVVEPIGESLWEGLRLGDKGSIIGEEKFPYQDPRDIGFA